MFRRSFLTKTLSSVAAMASNSTPSFSAPDEDKPRFSTDELLGKIRPVLFGKGFNLRREAADSFDSMRQAAAKEGLKLYSQSSFRSYEHQRRIWNRKYTLYQKKGWTGERIVYEIIRYSTIPGTSRHHWGTDLDIINLAPIQPKGDRLLEKHFQPGGVYDSLYRWLKTNASQYGFVEVYTQSSERTGFAYEPWHWSYANLSISMLKQFLTVDLNDELNDSKMVGRESLTHEILNRYANEWILGINPSLLP